MIAAYKTILLVEDNDSDVELTLRAFLRAPARGDLIVRGDRWRASVGEPSGRKFRYRTRIAS